MRFPTPVLVGCMLSLLIKAAVGQESVHAFPRRAVAAQNDSQVASVAGKSAEDLCTKLAAEFMPPSGLEINNTFSQYYPEGSMPSLELLTQTYPPGTLPRGTNVPTILDSVGPDVDIKSDAGYGKSDTRAAQNGPLGGLPAFCRFGAYIKTSDLTVVLSEVWMREWRRDLHCSIRQLNTLHSSGVRSKYTSGAGQCLGFPNQHDIILAWTEGGVRKSAPVLRKWTGQA